jgi:hypothetical protein
MNETKTCANQTAMHEPLASTDLNTASSVDAVWKIPIKGWIENLDRDIRAELLVI